MTRDPVSPVLSTAEIVRRQEHLTRLVRDAGALALDYFRRPEALSVESKGTQDFVTAADRAVEALLIGRLLDAFPADGVIGEEGGRRNGTSGATWIIDPIDGTSNFARGIPFWCISVALMTGGEIVAGLIFDPVRDELFSARKGAGAERDGVPIQTSAVTTPETARVNLSFSFRRPRQLLLTAIDRLQARYCDWTRLGSAALALAYVACGRLDGSWAAHVKVWDVAAGMCLVTEAGGTVSDFLTDDGLVQGNRLLATTPGMLAFLTECLGDLVEAPAAP
jgi:myo-inositol-1(or 4)-monophosphatase